MLKIILIYLIAQQFARESANGAKILAVMPLPSYSHQIFFRPLWKELAKRGHEVTLITTEPMKDKTLTNLREFDVSHVSDRNEAIFENVLALSGKKLEQIYYIFNYQTDIIRRVLLHSQVQELFNNKHVKFDLLMIEDAFPTAYVFKYRFDVPVIGISSMDVAGWSHEAVGNPSHWLLYPSVMIPFDSDMNFPQRLYTFVTVLLGSFYYDYWLVPRMNDIMRETFNLNVNDEIPSIIDLNKRIDMIFLNTNPVFSVIRPFTPSTISLAGGLHIETNFSSTRIPKDLNTFLDAAGYGVIYFSLGTNIKSKLLPKHLLQTFLKTFSELHQFKFLWKFELETLDDLPSNVKIMKWMPQQDVLRHKNVKLFICQGGLQSLEESLFAGVPMITIPFFADQHANSHRIVSNGVGLELMHETLTVETFKSTILEVANNPKYMDNVEKHAKLIFDKQIHPLDNAVWWTEYVLRHNGAQHLKGPTIPNYKFHYFDVVGCLCLFLVAIVLILYYLVKALLQFMRRRIFSRSKLICTKKINKNKTE